MKKFSLILAMIMVISLLGGCAGTAVVYYGDCTCPTGSHDSNVNNTPEKTPVVGEGAVKTGLYIGTGVSSEKAGEVKYDVTLVAVTVDDAGVIHSCTIDSIGTSVNFDASGIITSDLIAPIQTKNELGDAYGMVAYGGAVAEWDAQAKALADYAVGKTLDQLKNGAIDESGYAPDGSDLASSATIYLGGYVAGIEAAVGNAQHLGAQAGDELRLACIPSIKSSTSASAENPGNAQLDVDVTALTLNGGTITSCYIDSVQAKVSFDAAGAITSDLTAPVQTKNQLGEAYCMKAWGGAIAEWNEQAASFAQYVTGKTAADVAGIAVDQGTKPTDADLATSVTIAIGGFQALIQKAAQ